MLPVAASRCLWGPRLGLRGAALRLARQQMPSVCAARQLRSSSHRRSEALAGAPLDNAPKEYPPKIQQLVQDIASLTLLEISDLNELLKKTLKIQDVGLMPMGGMVPGPVSAAAPASEAAEEEDVPKQKERTHFTVRLTEAKPVDKVKLIKEIKNYVQGINLVQAKKLVESLPQEIKANVAKAEAENGMVGLCPLAHMQPPLVKLAIQFTNKNQYCYGSRALLGLHNMKRRQLVQIGYRVVELPHWEWLPLLKRTRLEKLAYLHEKVFTSAL